MMIRRFCRPLFSIFTTDICSVSPVCVVAAAHSLLFDLGDPAETARTYRDKPDVIRFVAAQSYHRLFGVGLLRKAIPVPLAPRAAHVAA
jgi:hypothetical protein